MSTIYLYIKQHKTTGLLYFGKTTNSNPVTYRGSGKYWSRHLKQHGNTVETLCLWEFDTMEECSEFAIRFSKDNNIVESRLWANLIDENAYQGGTVPGEDNPNFGLKKPEHSKLMSGESNPNFGKHWSAEWKASMSLKNSKRKYIITNPQGIEFEISNMKGWAKENNFYLSSIWRNMRGVGDTYKGYKFRYAS